MKKGFLLVIDGVDGSGKTTQIELLKQYLASQGDALQTEVISFPRYGQNLYADLVRRYLEGGFGPIGQIDPHFIALAYAGDRSLAKAQVEDWLSQGKLVVANRYVSASKAHLGANIAEDQRMEFIKWIDQLEYVTNEMPKEDLNILLNVDPKIGQQNARQDNLKDIHEESINHLQIAAKIYLDLAQSEPNWSVVNCMENANIRSIADISQELISVVRDKIGL